MGLPKVATAALVDQPVLVPLNLVARGRSALGLLLPLLPHVEGHVTSAPEDYLETVALVGDIGLTRMTPVVLKLLIRMFLRLVATMADLVMTISRERLRCPAAAVLHLVLVLMRQDVASTIGNTLLVGVESGNLKMMNIISLVVPGLLQTESVTNGIIPLEVLGGMEWQTVITFLEVGPPFFLFFRLVETKFQTQIIPLLLTIDMCLGRLQTEAAIPLLGIHLTAAFALAVPAR